MAILTPAQKARLGTPPKPYAIDVKIVNPDGTPTSDYHLYLTKLDIWLKRLVSILTE